MLLVDIFEPDSILQLIQQSIPAQKSDLVHQGFADYLWFDALGRRVQVERKQWGEVLSDPDHVEEQLRREYAAADETVLLVEGVAESTPWGMDVYIKSTEKPYYRIQHSFGTKRIPQPGLYHRIQSWFWSLDKAGISVYRTANLGDTASALVAWYKCSQKKEHTTLQRYIKPRITLKHQDPQVLTLMGIEGVALGPVKAQALIDYFGSIWHVFAAPVEELMLVDGIGSTLANKLVDVIRRPYRDYE